MYSNISSLLSLFLRVSSHKTKDGIEIDHHHDSEEAVKNQESSSEDNFICLSQKDLKFLREKRAREDANEAQENSSRISLVTSSKLSAGISIKPGYYNIKSSVGKYLTTCENCGPSEYKISVTGDATESTPSVTKTRWLIETVGKYITIKSYRGEYLTSCLDCWKNAKRRYAVFADKDAFSSNGENSKFWKLKKLSNGQWGLQNVATRGYLTRCFNCVNDATHSEYVFADGKRHDLIHEDLHWDLIAL